MLFTVHIVSVVFSMQGVPERPHKAYFRIAGKPHNYFIIDITHT
jgi:hypothetical protein